ncbi:hypothetical protein ABZ546_14305 [Brachybacterium paraconglomeratum]
MTDKTLGAYQRHEKHDADDFATARFATRLDGTFAARTATGPHSKVYPWRCSDIPGRSDRAMAEDGFTPVRECPDPEQHDNETTHPGGLSASEWKILAETYGRDLDRLRDDAELAEEFAALWKETAREHIGRARTALSYADAAQLARAVAAVKPCSCSAQRARAEKAEKERDEAREACQLFVRERDKARAASNRMTVTITRLLRALDLPENATADEIVKRAAVSRPLTPDAITDEMVERAHAAAAGFGTAADISASATFAMLTAALTEPPQRPDGAEEIDEHLRQANAAALGGALTPDQRRALADHLAGFGYRNPLNRAEDGAA